MRVSGVWRTKKCMKLLASQVAIMIIINEKKKLNKQHKRISYALALINVLQKASMKNANL